MGLTRTRRNPTSDPFTKAGAAGDPGDFSATQCRSFLHPGLHVGEAVAPRSSVVPDVILSWCGSLYCRSIVGRLYALALLGSIVTFPVAIDLEYGVPAFSLHLGDLVCGTRWPMHVLLMPVGVKSLRHNMSPQ